MAKFFLFFFTVLLSLSLGLFVGQNYFLSTESTKSAQMNYKPKIEFNLNFKEKFNSIMNSIFANNKIKSVESDKSLANKTEDNSYSEDINNLHKEYGIDLEYENKQDQTAKSNVNEKTKTEKLKPEALKISSNEATAQSKKGWVIQVGAFQAESDALNIEQKVKELGFPFYYYKADVKGQKWFRVNIGPFNTLPEATQFKKANNVQSKFKDAFVRQL